jgi:putative ABC transport system ATP-binding protein
MMLWENVFSGTLTGVKEEEGQVMITLSGINKAYGQKDRLFHALSDVDLTIPDGTSVAIIGKSGSGKSTLMHVMSGLDRPQQGEVVIDGQDILKLKSKAVDAFRSRKMGFIFQAFFVQANESCFNNISLPLEIAKVPRRDRKQRVTEALERVEMVDKINEKARSLSGGQKQRLAIARAIVTKPGILFADEPTGNLDSVTGERIENLLFDLNKEGMTLVIVTHDSELASRCSMQVHIKDGKIEQIVQKHSLIQDEELQS